MHHIIECDDPWFTKLEQGIKKVEGRKGTPSHRAIHVGDTLLFKCSSAARQFLAKVVKIQEFKTIEAYLNEVSVEEALPGIATMDEAKRIYDQWSTPDQIEKFGFLAIWIDIINS